MNANVMGVITRVIPISSNQRLRVVTVQTFSVNGQPKIDSIDLVIIPDDDKPLDVGYGIQANVTFNKDGNYVKTVIGYITTPPNAVYLGNGEEPVSEPAGKEPKDPVSFTLKATVIPNISGVDSDDILVPHKRRDVAFMTNKVENVPLGESEYLPLPYYPKHGTNLEIHITIGDNTNEAENRTHIKGVISEINSTNAPEWDEASIHVSSINGKDVEDVEGDKRGNPDDRVDEYVCIIPLPSDLGFNKDDEINFSFEYNETEDTEEPAPEPGEDGKEPVPEPDKPDEDTDNCPLIEGSITDICILNKDGSHNTNIRPVELTGEEFFLLTVRVNKIQETAVNETWQIIVPAEDEMLEGDNIKFHIKIGPAQSVLSGMIVQLTPRTDIPGFSTAIIRLEKIGTYDASGGQMLAALLPNNDEWAEGDPINLVTFAEVCDVPEAPDEDTDEEPAPEEPAPGLWRRIWRKISGWF